VHVLSVAGASRVSVSEIGWREVTRMRKSGSYVAFSAPRLPGPRVPSCAMPLARLRATLSLCAEARTRSTLLIFGFSSYPELHSAEGLRPRSSSCVSISWSLANPTFVKPVRLISPLAIACSMV